MITPTLEFIQGTKISKLWRCRVLCFGDLFIYFKFKIECYCFLLCLWNSDFSLFNSFIALLHISFVQALLPSPKAFSFLVFFFFFWLFNSIIYRLWILVRVVLLDAVVAEGTWILSWNLLIMERVSSVTSVVSLVILSTFASNLISLFS